MSLARFSAVARLELRTQIAGPLFWALLACVAFATLTVNPSAFVDSGDAAVAGVRPFVNSRYAMAQAFGLTGFLFYTFFASIMAGMSVIRDDEANVSDLLHSTPLTPGEYVYGKFCGVVTALGLALALHVLLAIGWYQLAAPGATLGPFRVANYALPALAFAAPGIWFSAGLAFAVGERTRRPMAVYFVPVATFVVVLFFLWTWTPSWLPAGIDRMLMVLDPTSLRWLGQTIFAVDRGVEFYNTAPLALDATFLLGRAVTVALPLVAVLTSVRHCRAAITASAGARLRPWRASRDQGDVPRTESTAFRPLGELRMAGATPAFLASAVEVAWSELRDLRSQPTLYLFTPLVMFTVVEFAATEGDVFGAPVIVTAGRMAVGTVEALTTLLCLLLLFQTVESLDRERRTGVDALLYASPVRTGALLVGKGLASAAVVAVVMAACLAASVAAIAIREGGRVEVWPFALVWGLLLPPTLFLWRSFVTAVLAATRDRYVTYAVGLGALALTAYLFVGGSMTWVTNWPLWGALRWSDLGTFDLARGPLLLNRVTVLGLGILLSVVSVRLFVRTERDAAAGRIGARSLAREALRLAPFALLPVVTGAYLAAQVGAGFQGDSAADRARDYWRRNVATWSGAPTATLTHVDLRVVLSPESSSMDVDGSFTMVNRSETPLRQLAFTVGPSFEGVTWTVDGIGLSHDDRSGLHVLTVPDAVAPGREARVGFAYRAVTPNGITRNGGGVSEFILPSGVVLHTLGPNLMPIPGFVDGIGVDERNRSEPREVGDDFWTETLAPVSGLGLSFTSRVEVTAPSEYTVNSVGEKTAEHAHDGRTTVIWESAYPVRALNIVAGRWDVRRRAGTEVFFHPDHAANVDEISDALAAARSRYSEWFHPYPWRDLRLSEFPNMVERAQGFPTNISFSEGMGFLTRSDPRSRQAFVVTAHEAAHQWWGNLIVPGEGPGADVLVEGMAHYATLLLLESELGPEARIEFARRIEESYAERRRVDAERPLVETISDGRATTETVVYDKGAWVMWMLHNHLGRERMLAGLREFIQRFVAGDDHPALHDLVETLRPYAADPVAYQGFVDEWLRGVVLPEYRVTHAVVTRSGDGWQVTATVENVGTGTMPVEIAVSGGRRQTGARTTLTLAPGQPQTVSLRLDVEPRRLTVDPDALVLQLNRDRAVAELDTATQSRSR